LVAALVAVLVNTAVDIAGVTVLPGTAWALATVAACGLLALATVIWAGVWSRHASATSPAEVTP
jgi:hypothetical protein